MGTQIRRGARSRRYTTRLEKGGREPVPMDRIPPRGNNLDERREAPAAGFRPNVVVSGGGAWAEDAWTSLTRADGLALAVAKVELRRVASSERDATRERALR